MKLIVGPLPMLGFRGHSAALTKALRSSFLSVHADSAASYSGRGAVGAKFAYSWTCVSTVKLLMGSKACRSGERYSFTAASMSHDDGSDPGVKSENERWYVSAYFIDLRSLRLILSASCGDVESRPPVCPDRMCAIVAFSSPYNRCSSSAMNAERGEFDEEGTGTWLGG